MNYAIVGMRGNAKTPCARLMADKCPRRVIFDSVPARKNFPRRTTQSYATTAEGARAALVTLGAHEDVDGQINAEGPIIDEVLISPHGDVDDVFRATCEGVIAWLNDYRDETPAPGLAFVVDECWSLSEKVMPEFFDYLARAEQQEKFQLIVTAHSPIDISPQLRRIVQYWLLFQMVDKRDLDIIRDRCGDKVAEQLPTLGVGEFVLFRERPRRAWEVRKGFARMRD